MAPSPRADFPQLTSRRCRLRYRHVHAERRRRVADGVARRRTDLRCAHADRFLATVFSAGPSRRFRRRYRRPPQARSVYRVMDDGCSAASRRLNHRRTDVALAAAGVDLRPLRRRCVRNPTWRAILPELVPQEDLAPASALNGIEFNLARAIGPALAGMIIAAAGVAAAFFVNCFSFLGVIAVVAKWKRPIRKRTTPPETLAGATVAALRYVRHSPAILGVVVRTGVVMFFSSVLFALLPTLARSVNETAIGYGLLLGCFGAGAILGALIMQPARAMWSTEVVVSAAVIILGLVIVAMGGLHRLSTLAPVMLIGGAVWVIFISIISAALQSLAPDWVRARVVAIFMLVYQGSFALGSATWGAVAQRAGIRSALVYAGVGTIGSVAFVFFSKLPDSTLDLRPWDHWRMPAVIKDVEPDLLQGPVLVTVKYSVIPGRTTEFVETIHQYARIRLRDGAYEWGIFRDTEVADLYLEIFLVNSWAEHLRQHERQTQADRELELRLSTCISKDPEVHHLIYTHSEGT